MHLILENDANDAARLARGGDGRALLADAQWNDDVHHAMHVLATGESDGYYADYADAPLRHLGRALAEGFSYQGECSAYGGGPRGTPSAQLPPLAFVNALQTHDQIGNRALGERIGMLAAACGREAALRALVACLLLSPSPPMLFMGEEWGAGTPFLYFCDFAGDLARAVTEGRRNEFGRFARFADAQARAAIPDPNALDTFQRSRLDWRERRRAAARRMAGAVHPAAAAAPCRADAASGRGRQRHLGRAVAGHAACSTGRWAAVIAGTCWRSWPTWPAPRRWRGSCRGV